MGLLNRPVLLLSLIAIAPLSAMENSTTMPSLNWKFGVLLDDKVIGYHHFRVSQHGDRQLLETEAEFDVKFLFITAFRYRHRNVESWENGCLTSINAFTSSNGKELKVNGRLDADRFELNTMAGPETLPNCVQSFAYWMPGILDADRLLNSQTGEYETVSVAFSGNDAVVVGERSIDALKYTLSTRAGDITLWYSTDDHRWLALEAPAKGGRTLRYEPLAVPGSLPNHVQIASFN